MSPVAYHSRIHRIGALVLTIFNHRELIGHDKFIMAGVVKINQPNDIAALIAFVLAADFDASGKQAMEGFVVAE